MSSVFAKKHKNYEMERSNPYKAVAAHFAAHNEKSQFFTDTNTQRPINRYGKFRKIM